jgi:hypothetical protein
MKAKPLVLLLIAALVLIGLANWSGRRRQSPAASRAGTALLPDLDVNAVNAIEIHEKDDILRLARLNDVWSVTNAHNYPADFQSLVKRLIALREIKIGHVQRGMSIDDTDATRVRLLDARDQPLAELTLGAARQSKNVNNMGRYRPNDGRYLSRNGGGDVFLVKESLDDWTAATEGWLDTQIVSIAPNDIATIEMRSMLGGDPVVLDRASGSLELVDLDEEKEQFESGRADGVDTVLQYLRFNRIADPSLPPEALGFATGHLYRVALKNGDIYHASLGAAVEGNRYFKVGVESGPPSTNESERVAAETRVTEANAKLSPWTFLIASYTADNMIRTRAELVAPKPSETNAPAGEAATENTPATAAE